MRRDAFTFKNIEFGYKNKVVLHIPQLNIPSTGMIFIVGPSGVGKSTLLESMGLMSNTVINFNGAVSTFRINEKDLDPTALWQHDEQQLTLIRESLFSFIFQNTNLMPNFSILENILMAANFSAQDEQAILLEIQNLFEKMSLPQEVLHRYPYQISGGQKQRVAFVRALVGKFSILLADEPTGNLDMLNSKALFEILSNHIQAKKKVAVVVTHHMELAREYGDKIIEIVSTHAGPATAKIADQDILNWKLGVNR